MRKDNLVLTVWLQVEDGSWEAVGEVGVIYFILVVVGPQQSVEALHLVVHRRHTAAAVGDPHGVDILLLAPVRDVLPHGAVFAFVVFFPYGLGGAMERAGMKRAVILPIHKLKLALSINSNGSTLSGTRSANNPLTLMGIILFSTSARSRT